MKTLALLFTIAGLLLSGVALGVALRPDTNNMAFWVYEGGSSRDTTYYRTLPDGTRVQALFSPSASNAHGIIRLQERQLWLYDQPAEDTVLLQRMSYHGRVLEQRQFPVRGWAVEARLVGDTGHSVLLVTAERMNRGMRNQSTGASHIYRAYLYNLPMHRLNTVVEIETDSMWVISNRNRETVLYSSTQRRSAASLQEIGIWVINPNQNPATLGIVEPKCLLRRDLTGVPSPGFFLVTQTQPDVWAVATYTAQSTSGSPGNTTRYTMQQFDLNACALSALPAFPAAATTLISTQAASYLHQDGDLLRYDFASGTTTTLATDLHLADGWRSRFADDRFADDIAYFDTISADRHAVLRLDVRTGEQYPLLRLPVGDITNQFWQANTFYAASYDNGQTQVWRVQGAERAISLLSIPAREVQFSNGMHASPYRYIHWRPERSSATGNAILNLGTGTLQALPADGGLPIVVSPPVQHTHHAGWVGLAGLALCGVGLWRGWR